MDFGHYWTIKILGATAATHGTRGSNKNKCVRNWRTLAVAYAPGRRFLCSHQMATLFYVKWCHGRQLETEIRLRKSMDRPI